MNTSESDCQDLTDQGPKSNIFLLWSLDNGCTTQALILSFLKQTCSKVTHTCLHILRICLENTWLSWKYMLCLENLRFADIQNDDYDKLGKKFCNENRCWLYLWVCSCTNLNMPVQCTICGQNYFLGKRTQIQPSNAMLEEDVRQTMWICKVLFPAWTYSVLLVVVFKSTSWSFN